MITIENLWRDSISGSYNGRACNRSILLNGRRGRILCTYLMAAGEGKHPTVIFCHGYPGNEENMDIAHALRRVGFHVMNFHYSGSWGSDGDFSFGHCLEDTESVLDYLLSESDSEADPDNLFIFGQSMGGFIAYHMLVKREELKAGILAMPCDFGLLAEYAEKDPAVRKTANDILTDGINWLSGTSVEDLYQEALDFARNRTFEKEADRSFARPMLVLSGTLDTLCPSDTMILPWVNKIRTLQDEKQTDILKKLQYHEINTDHMFADARCTVTKVIAEYLFDLTG